MSESSHRRRVPKGTIAYSSFLDLIDQLRGPYEKLKADQAREKQNQQRRELVGKMIPKFRFRLAENCKQDFDAVRELESRHVLNPKEVKRELVEFQAALQAADGDYSKLDPKKFPFIQGEHVSLVPEDLLSEVWHRGYIWMAEYEHAGEHTLAGYTYGLSTIPSKETDGDHHFPNLDAGDIVGSGKKIVLDNRENCMVGWRTTVDKATPDGEQLRRLGLGSVLKLLAMMSHLRRKKHFTLNVGSISGMPNQASALYNTNFLDMYGVRSHTTPILIPDEIPSEIIGMLSRKSKELLFRLLHYFRARSHPHVEEYVGDMYWTALGNSIRGAMNKLLAPEGPINRTGWGEAVPHFETIAREAEEEMMRRDAGTFLPM